jgi:hypothetical protein
LARKGREVTRWSSLEEGVGTFTDFRRREVSLLVRVFTFTASSGKRRIDATVVNVSDINVKSSSTRCKEEKNNNMMVKVIAAVYRIGESAVVFMYRGVWRRGWASEREQDTVYIYVHTLV